MAEKEEQRRRGPAGMTAGVGPLHCRTYVSLQRRLKLSGAALRVLCLLPWALLVAAGPSSTAATPQERAWDYSISDPSLLKAFLHRMAPLECGSWQQEYAELHWKQVEGGDAMFMGGSEDPDGNGSRIMVFDCYAEGGFHEPLCQGFGDTLKGIVSAFALAVMTRRAFVIRAPVIQHAFEPRTIDWRPPQEGGQWPSPSWTSVYSSKRRQRLLRHSILGSPMAAVSVNLLHLKPVDAYKYFLKFVVNQTDEDEVLIFRGHKGTLSHMLGAMGPVGDATATWWHQRGVTSAPQAAACFLRFLFQPSAPVLGRVATYMAALQKPAVLSIGMHIRTGDDSFVRRSGWLQQTRSQKQLVQCGESISEIGRMLGRQVVWFVASDSLTLKRKLAKKYKQVLLTDIKPAHLAPADQGYASLQEMHRAIEDTVGEWLLFAQCQYHIFRLSGWSLTAALFTTDPSSPMDMLYPRNIEVDTYAAIDNATVCDMRTPPDWVRMAESWGGI